MNYFVEVQLDHKGPENSKTLQCGNYYTCKLTFLVGYGIIVIEDTVRTSGLPVGEYASGTLTIGHTFDKLELTTASGSKALGSDHAILHAKAPARPGAKPTVEVLLEILVDQTSQTSPSIKP